MKNMNEEIINAKNQAMAQNMGARDNAELEQIRIDHFGKNGKVTNLLKKMKEVPQEDRQHVGILINETKSTIESLIANQKNSFKENAREWFDPTVPGVKPKIGHLHLVTQAIDEI